MPDAPALLELARVSRHFTVRRGLWRSGAVLRAVEDVSLSLRPGQTLGIVGESGCGKTTVARMALGLLPVTAGTVSFRGKVITAAERSAVAAGAQMIFQDPASTLDPRLTVRRSVEEPLRVHASMSGAQRHAAAARMFESVGLPAETLRRYPHELSGGQLQRVGIARALIGGPRVVVCDEPVSSLDVSVQAQVLNLLRSLQRERGLAYLFVSHDIGVIRFISDFIAVMYLGRVVETAPRREFFANTRHPYSRALLNAVPTVSRVGGSGPPPLAGELPSPITPPPGCAFQTRCPQVMPKCRVELPKLRPVAAGHLLACHLEGGGH